MIDIKQRARDILGVDLNQSLHHLIGYWYATDTREVFDTELAIEMIEICSKELRNPVGVEARELQNFKLKSDAESDRDRSEIEKLQKKIDIMVEIVEKYGNEKNWKSGFCLIEREVAFNALKQLAESK